MKAIPRPIFCLSISEGKEHVRASRSADFLVGHCSSMMKMTVSFSLQGGSSECTILEKATLHLPWEKISALAVTDFMKRGMDDARALLLQFRFSIYCGTNYFDDKFGRCSLPMLIGTRFLI